MLRIIQNSSPAGAASYYSTADYYSEGQELVGRWRGLGAEKLGLLGEVQKKDWDALCDNRHPGTGLPLTIRRKEERRVGFDFNFHVPKSVSVLYSLSKDERILDAFRDAVDQTMRDMELEMKTRVRKEGKN
jgi:conjugative relaxase-like TrwC/TraI family protein